MPLLIKNKISFTLSVLAVFIIVYFYFLKWRTNVIYGDDISIFTAYSGLHGVWDKLNIDSVFQKFRPVQGLAINILINVFEKHLKYYYLFNICIQVLNIFILAQLIDLFLKSPFFSLFFSLIAGISRFSYFNITQLFNGGALEGLAMSFFLLSLFFIINVLNQNNVDAKKNGRGILLSILFANLCMYTHERYIVLFPFIIIVVLCFPGLRMLTRRQKVKWTLYALGSMALNFVIKKYIISMPFLVGTGGTSITISFSSAIAYFSQAVMSIFQFNDGPEYLVGITFSSLSPIDKTWVFILSACFLLILTDYIASIRKAIALKDKGRLTRFYIFISLALLFGMTLLPAVITIRLEQRWLQASLNIFVLMLALAVSDLDFKKRKLKSALNALFIVLFLLIDHNYLVQGAGNIYMYNSENLAAGFEKATAAGIIRPGTTKLFIWESKKNSNDEQTFAWILGGGAFFSFYQGSTKQLVFADSSYKTSDSDHSNLLTEYNKRTDQLVYYNGKVFDISKLFLRDSLRSFDGNAIEQLVPASDVKYDERQLLIDSGANPKFLLKGFYTNEHGLRWTNGKASIGFIGDYTIRDSLEIVLNTYMPPVCKAIDPKISISDDGNKRGR
jgi:hypothetical protein